jgi:hypothetical protein
MLPDLKPRVGFVQHVQRCGQQSIYSRLAGEPVAPAGAADAGRHLVADQLAAAVGQDRWTADPTCAPLLVAIGREPSDAAAVRGHAAEGRGLAHASGIRRVWCGAIFDDGAGLAAEASADAPGKGSFRGVACSREAKPAPSGAAERRGPKPAETLCSKRSSGLYRSWKPRVKTLNEI